MFIELDIRKNFHLIPVFLPSPINIYDVAREVTKLLLIKFKC